MQVADTVAELATTPNTCARSSCAMVQATAFRKLAWSSRHKLSAKAMAICPFTRLESSFTTAPVGNAKDKAFIWQKDPN